MWKLALPYVPGDTVYIPICSHMGQWGIDVCKVSHYTVKSEDDVTVFMRQQGSNGLRMSRPNEVFSTPEAAQNYIEEKKAEFSKKNES